MKFVFQILAEDPIWYHGRTVTDETFDLNHTGKGNDQSGPGFYFTSDVNDARGYAFPKGIVLEVKLTPRKLVTGKPKRSEIEKLIKMAPNYKDTLTNFAENPPIALRQAIDGTIKYNPLAVDAFQQMWIDFYRHEPKQYLEGMIKLGYDGHEVKTNVPEIRHMVIYNPAAIKIIK